MNFYTTFLTASCSYFNLPHRSFLLNCPHFLTTFEACKPMFTVVNFLPFFPIFAACDI